MPSTTLSPPKSFLGITSRELLSAEDTTGGPPINSFGPNTRGPFTIRAGPELIITEPGADFVRVAEGNTDPITLNIAGYKRISFQCTIQETSVPEGTRLALRGLRAKGIPWEYLDTVNSAPWLPLHEVNTDGNGNLIPVLSGWFTIDTQMDIDNLTLEWGIYGGDGTGEVVIGNIYVELSAATKPPTQVTPTPTPPINGLIAYWKLTEGIGDTVDSKPPSVAGNILYLGNGAGSDAGDPTWGTNVLILGGGTAGDKDKMTFTLSAAQATAVKYGCAIFFYYQLDTLGGGGAVMGMAENVDGSPIMRIDGTGGSNTRLVSVTIQEDSGGLPLRTVTSTTALPNGWDGVLGFWHDGTNLRTYVVPVGGPIDGLPEATVACGLARDGGAGRQLVLGANAVISSSGVDNSKFGHIWFGAGTGVRDLTPSKIAELCADILVDYS